MLPGGWHSRSIKCRSNAGYTTVLGKILYRNPRLPDSAGVKLVPDPAKLAAEKQTLEKQGFTIVEIVPPLLGGGSHMNDDIVELAVIAPVAAIKRIERSQIGSCTVGITDPMRVIVRLTDGSTLIVTKASFDRAGLSIGIRLV
jgi:hypothetical protein